MSDVFLHVGLPKTGTTTIQTALEARASSLGEHGVLFPGGWHHAQRLAAYDLIGQRIGGDDAHVVAGAFARLVEEMRAYHGSAIVLSDEDFGLARPRHVRRFVHSLPDHRVFVVVTVRDFARTLVSAWQQSVVMGSTCTWRDFVDAVRDPSRGSVSAATSFWLRHDVFRVVDAWGTAVPPGRIRIVTVPPAGSAPGVLLERFASATGLPAGLLHADLLANQSLGAAELEVIRRLNHSVVGRVNMRQYRHIIEHGIRPELRVEGSRPLRLPAEHHAWARDQAEALIGRLGRRGHPVFGDLRDLVPATQDPGRRFDDLATEELLAAAEAALTSLAVAHGKLFKRYRRAFVARSGQHPSTAELLGSSARATEFGIGRAALRRADDLGVLSWAARTYLRYASGRTR